MTETVKTAAPKILEAIQASKSVLLHCHPLPDPDSVCSALAMKFALEGLGKKAVVIKGDSSIPAAFSHFPGAKDIVLKSFSEVDLKDFDLFISLDSGSPGMVSRLETPVFPLLIPTIVIDHHDTNDMYGTINLVDVSSPAVCFTLFQLFREWKVNMTPEIAMNLFIGAYTDSGGFKYPPTDYRVLEAASELAKIAPDYTHALFIMENSQTKEAIYFQALALSSVKTFLNDTIAIAAVSNKELKDKNIPEDYIRGISISNMLKSV
ncbi:MAG: DHH family phosphoesterase, partial [Candidatus Pacebacteria bacterium]|nr:DHH family phosphoesterase [Candidatus Paceibacterota bacterium]